MLRFSLQKFKTSISRLRFLDRFRTITNVMGDAVGCAIVESVCRDELNQEPIPNGGGDLEQNLYPLIESGEERKGDVSVTMGSTI